MPGQTDPSLQELTEDFDVPVEVSRENEPATPETYDRHLVQDHSGLLMQATARPRGSYRLDPRVHQNGEMLVCGQCKIEVFRVFCSSVGPYMQVICANEECGAMYPVLEMTPVQVNTNIAQSHGLYVPQNLRNTGAMNRQQRRSAQRRR